MKALRYISGLLMVIFCSIDSQAQTVQKEEYQLFYDLKSLVQPDYSLQVLLDSVYPDVKFLAQANSRGPSVKLFLFYIQGDDTLRADEGTLKQLQIEKTFSNDSVFRYSVSTLVRTYIFLDLVRRQEQYFFEEGCNLKADDIQIIPGVVYLSEDHSQKYFQLDTANRFINMRAKVKLNPSSFYYYNGKKVKAKEAIYEFQIVDGIILGRAVSVNDFSGIIIEENYVALTAGSSLYYLKVLKNTIREKKKNRIGSSSNFWTGVYLSSVQNLDVLSLGPSGETTHHITIEDNGVFTNGNTKFQVTGVDNNIPNPELRIYTADNFGNTPVLLFSSYLENTTNDSRETINSYTPQNNGSDGFCVFQIWSNNAFIHEFPNHYIALQRKKTDLTFGKILNVYYAKRFFHNHPSGITICDTYINKLINYYNSTWQKQVIDYQINNGNPPTTTNNTYSLSVNPYQTVTDYIFQRNYFLVDCYEFPTQARHIGITANPELFIPNISPYTQYSEDEFLQIALFHEFYHGMQFTFNNIMFGDSKKYWLIEGQARAIQSIVGSPEIEFKGDNYGLYAIDANNYIWDKLNSSLLQISYPYCMFWRFLYENYSTSANIKDKLAIFRETCMGFTATTLPAIQTHMDTKLNTNNYPDMKSAIKDFAKRVAFNDPVYGQWSPCPSDSYYSHINQTNLDFNNTEVSASGLLNSSYGIDYFQITFRNKGKAFLNFNGDPDGDGRSPEFYLNLVFLDEAGNNLVIPLYSGLATAEIDISNANTIAYLIVARLDSDEANTPGPYGIMIGPSIPANILKANFTKVAHKSASNSIAVNTSVDFIDLSHTGSYPIQDWQWSFPGAQTTSSTVPNPIGIIYETAGVYPVSLTITDASNAEDTKTINDYIVVYEPGGGSGGTLEVIGSNPGFGLPGQQLSFSLSIITGTPPFDVEIDYGDGTTFQTECSYDLFYNQLHTFSNSNTYEITYTVVDALGNTGNDQVPISIGLPGSHQAAFTFTWSNPPNPNVLGTNMPVNFLDQTSGGYQPYYQWHWILGKGLNTGSQPLFSNGYPWLIITNWDGTASGTPSETVTFTAFDTYPVTLMVYDNDGWMAEETELLLVSEITKCLSLHPNYLNPYNLKTGKHVIKLNQAITSIAQWDGWGSYFNHWHSSDYCFNEYPSGGDGIPGGAENVITNARWKIFNNSGVVYSNSYSMPQDWGSGNYNCDNIGGVQWTRWWERCDNSWNSNIINPILNQAGKYFVQLETWNRNVHPNIDQIYPENDKNLSMYYVLKEPLYVVDCDVSQNINSSYSNALYDDQLAGSFNFANSSPVNISNITKIAFEACNEIVLYPNFTSYLGSDYRATVSDFQSDKSYSGRGEFNTDIIAKETPPDNLIYPNPNNGSFYIKSSTIYTKEEIRIFDLLGRSIDFKLEISGNNTFIRIDHPAQGTYFMQLLTNTGVYKTIKLIINY